MVGSAVFAGHWMEEATEFVRQHRSVLASRPVWLFSSGPIGAMAKKHEPADPKGIAKLKRAIGPRDHRVFFGAWDRGKLDRGTLGLAERIVAKRFLPEGDWRDWREIEAWATDIALALTAPRTVRAEVAHSSAAPKKSKASAVPPSPPLPWRKAGPGVRRPPPDA